MAHWLDRSPLPAQDLLLVQPGRVDRGPGVVLGQRKDPGVPKTKMPKEDHSWKGQTLSLAGLVVTIQQTSLVLSGVRHYLFERQIEIFLLLVHSLNAFGLG